MDGSKILSYAVIGCLLVVGRVSAYYNQTYGSYSFILSDVNADISHGKTPLAYAQDWCRSNAYTLATIPDKEVENYIKQFIGNAINNGLMTALNIIILNGKLYTSLPGTWTWVNGQQINGVDIKDQPDLSYRYLFGYLKTSDYKIYASTYNGGRTFICEYPGNDCVGGSSLNGRCYQRKTNELTWYGARNKCFEEGGDLASFETLNDTTFRSTLGSSLLTNAEYWVGIQRVEWRWEDTGAAIKYTNWESGAPSNVLDGQGLSLRVPPRISEWLWYDYDCSASCRIICMANQTAAITTIPTSSTNVKDATPTDAVSGSDLTSPSSSTPPSVQPASTASKTNKIDIPLALGLGIGLGMGVILVIAIVLGVILIRRRQKSKSESYSEPTSSSDANVRNELKESDIDTGYEEMKNNGPNGNANQGAIYAAVQPRGTLLPPTNYAETHGQQIVYADFDLVQKP